MRDPGRKIPGAFLRCGAVSLSALMFGILPPSAAAAPAGDARAKAAGVAAGSAGGAVAAEQPLATAAGLAALRDGGNAVDAAVATALALAVVYPEAGNLGGGGFAVVRLHGEVRALDFREVAPAAARRDMYLDAQGRVRPGASRSGPLAAGVPGSPSGLYELHRALGKLPWARVVAPAVSLARDGFEIDEHLCQLLAREPQLGLLQQFPESAALWLPGGKPPPAGTRLRLPRLAATLEAYGRQGPAAVMEGGVAAEVQAASRQHGGVLTVADLAAYRPVWRQPVRFTAYGWEVATMPLPSAGGILLGQTFAMLQRLGWAELPRAGADRAHLLAEVFRRSYVDRILLGDPARSRVTAAELLDPRWIARRAAGIARDRATPSATLAPWPAGMADSSGTGSEAGATAHRGAETTHLSAADAEGNAVALTTTLNGLFGCGLYVPEIGFLNNEMDDFATAAGQKPPAAGPALPPGEANAVAPGRRMLSSMTPTIAWRGDELIALGGRGSLRIPTHTAQVLLNLLVNGDALQAAVSLPRLHQQAFPDHLEVEAGALTDAAARELERRGHHLVPPGAGETARVNAVRCTSGGRCAAALDPRGTLTPAAGGGRQPVPQP
jgi:gamma-glutamyltranspeptidase/glutathione hydrolase